MLSALKFVQGAVAKKDYVPALTHFLIKNKTVMGYNGELALCSPIDVDFDCAPNADQFVKAIKACETFEGTITLHMATSGKLVVRAGKFRAFIDCADITKFPPVAPSGQTVALAEGVRVLPALEHLLPFVAIDASRPWACGVLFDGECAYATNNIVLMQYWLGCRLPYRVNIPSSAVREMVRVGEEPIEIQLDDTRLTFRYEDGRWLSTQLIAVNWPDVSGRFDMPSNQQPFPKHFFESLEELLPFTDDIGRLHLLPDRVATSASDEAGASVKVDGLPGMGIYNLKQMINLKNVAKTIDFTMYPKPVLFHGTVSRGIFCGILN